MGGIFGQPQSITQSIPQRFLSRQPAMLGKRIPSVAQRRILHHLQAQKKRSWKTYTTVTWREHVGAEFQRVHRQSPFHVNDNSNDLIPELVELFTAWTNEDSPPAKVTVLDVNHLHFLFSYSSNQKNKYLIHQTHLVAGAFFFGMRPCEYSSV
jgi:hypothetical protein